MLIHLHRIGGGTLPRTQNNGRSHRRFGLIGYPLGHSLSPYIHERIMEVAGIDGEYRLYELEPGSLPKELPRLLDALHGLNCTLPHKEAIVKYLEKLAPSAAEYGAVNTVYGRTGYNTDGRAFASCGVPMDGRKVRILGAGGVARVLAIEAVRAGAREIVVQARNLPRAEHLVGEVQRRGFRHISALPEPKGDSMDCNVVLNGTPVGMWPHVDGLPVTMRQLEGVQAVFDTIYNPTATRLVLRAKSRDMWTMGGLQMLFAQALAAQKIWNPEVDFTKYNTELEELRQGLAREVLRRSPIKLVLTGFMGSGKTHVGKALADTMSLPFVDLDERIAGDYGQSITDIFASQGEGAFREMERRVFLDQIKHPETMVMSTGGGTLVQEGLMETLLGSGVLVIYLNVPFDLALQRIALDGGNRKRPLLTEGLEKAKNLYEMRQPLYEAVADLEVPASLGVDEIVKRIMTAFGW